MLEEITIQNLGIIENTTLPFTPGLTVITGETGAGKTMILNALGLLLGKRADKAIVREGTDFASVEGCWNVNNLSVTPAVEETGAVIEDDMLYINRTVYATGKTRAVIGGKTSPASSLAGIGDGLVHVHGQSDQIRLKNPVAQREALDSFAGAELTAALTKYKDAYTNYRSLTKKLVELQTNMVARAREYEELTAAVEELDNFRPLPEEDEQLKAEIAVLMNIENIQEALTLVSSYLATENEYGIPEPLTAVALVVKTLEGVVEHDKKLEELYSLSVSAHDQLTALTDGAASYFDDLDADSLERLNYAQERVAGLTKLKRKFGPTLNDVLNFWEEAEAKIEDLNPENNNIELVEQQTAEAKKVLLTQANTLTAIRVKQANLLQEAVNKELADLAMVGSELNIAVETEKMSSTGQDKVVFLLKTPAATSARPLEKSASGGELSRIMLALEIVLADPTKTPTFVFDEVDSGVSGATATKIGQKLANLAAKAQVIVVTHLPQVAVFFDNHLRVVKTLDEQKLSTTVQQLSAEESVREFTRMLSGLPDSESGRTHAEEMLGFAAEYKHTI